MKSELNLYVHGVFPDGQIIETGRLLIRNLLNPQNMEGFFRYAPSFLEHPLHYSIDPVHLPLSPETFNANLPLTGLHHIFDDSLPDAWGRHILARKGGIERSRFTPAHLLAILRGSGLGRFLYTENPWKIDFKDNSIDYIEITRAIEEAGRLEESFDIDTAELQHLLACGSSAGGARPKVLTRKNNSLFIAKLASRKDPHPNMMLSLEQAGMILAKQAGLQVAKVERCSMKNRDLLLIKRFDVTDEGGRYALASFRTLLGLEDHYSASYSDMAEIIRMYSTQPAKDLEQLFRQMAINVLLVNSDDHLQNFAMLHTRDGWQLSPAYDIVPNIYQSSQIVMINHKHHGIEASDLLAEGREYGLSLQKCRSLLQEVINALAVWQDVFTDCGVPESHTGKLRSIIGERLQRIGNECLQSQECVHFPGTVRLEKNTYRKEFKDY